MTGATGDVRPEIDAPDARHRPREVNTMKIQPTPTCPPPEYSVRDLWDAGLDLWDLEHDRENASALPVSRYLSVRGIHPKIVAHGDLARMLPRVAVPRWAALPGSPAFAWTRSYYRLLLPLHDHRGVLRSVAAHWADTPVPEVSMLLPEWYSASGLVFANLRALAVLTKGRWSSAIPLLRREFRVVVGPLAFLRAAVRWPEWQVIGLLPDSPDPWPDVLTERLPAGSRFLLDFGRPGAVVGARSIKHALAGRGEVYAA